MRLAAGSDRAAIAQEAANKGGQISFTYRNVFSGFAARLPDQVLNALRRNPAVVSIETDQIAAATDTQTSPPWGLDRIDQASLPLDSTFTYPAVANSVTSYVLD